MVLRRRDQFAGPHRRPGPGVLQSGSIALVVADRAGIGTIARAEKAGIPCVNHRAERGGFEEGGASPLSGSTASTWRAGGLSGHLLGRLHPPLSAALSSTSIPPSSPPSAGKGFLRPAGPPGNALDYGVKVSRGHGPLCQRGRGRRRDHPAKRRWTSSPATRRRFCKKE